MNRRLAMLAAVLGATGVSLGALGAHGVKRAVEGLPDALQRLEWWETAARYHLLHALAVAVAALVAAHVPGRAARLAGALFGVGVLGFSGSLYALALTGERSLGHVTPFGGLALLAGWTVLAFAAFKLPVRTS